MSSLFDWLLRDRCLKHADPLFDRDEHGRAIFRCPRCLATWEFLPELQKEPVLTMERKESALPVGGLLARRPRLRAVRHA